MYDAISMDGKNLKVQGVSHEHIKRVGIAVAGRDAGKIGRLDLGGEKDQSVFHMWMDAHVADGLADAIISTHGVSPAGGEDETGEWRVSWEFPDEEDPDHLHARLETMFAMVDGIAIPDWRLVKIGLGVGRAHHEVIVDAINARVLADAIKGIVATLGAS